MAIHTGPRPDVHLGPSALAIKGRLQPRSAPCMYCNKKKKKGGKRQGSFTKPDKMSSLYPLNPISIENSCCDSGDSGNGKKSKLGRCFRAALETWVAPTAALVGFGLATAPLLLHVMQQVGSAQTAECPTFAPIPLIFAQLHRTFQFPVRDRAQPVTVTDKQRRNARLPLCTSIERRNKQSPNRTRLARSAIQLQPN